MDDQLNYAPCGFLSISEDGRILTINHTLLQLLGYDLKQLTGEHINTILPVSSRMFVQFYFFPLLKGKKRVDEMYISLQSSNGEELPVLLNAHLKGRKGLNVIDCALFPIRKRDLYENELLIAKKEAEYALSAKQKINDDLEDALESLEIKQNELIKLNKQNQQYKKDTKKELELARKIQVTSLTEPICNQYIQIEAHYQASSELSGDIYGFYQIDKHRYGIIILDVMGHGISSALITMSLHSLFHRLITNGLTVATVLKELDNHLHTLFQNSEDAWHYCTATYLLIDTDQQKIDYINAGHPPGVLQDSNGDQYQFSSSTPPLGAFEGIEFKQNTFTYTKGSKLILYTDGVTDAVGFESLNAILKQNFELPLSKVKEKITHSLEQEEEKSDIHDDQCFILVELR